MQNKPNHTVDYQLTVTDLKGEHTFPFNNIIRLEAADNYTVIYFNNHQYPFTVAKVLKVYDELLSPYGFIRTHRSHLVNTRFITQVEKKCILMEDASIIQVAKRKRKCMKKLAY